MPTIAIRPSTNSDTTHNRWGVTTGTPDEEINTDDFATDEDLAALPSDFTGMITPRVVRYLRYRADLT